MNCKECINNRNKIVYTESDSIKDTVIASREFFVIGYDDFGAYGAYGPFTSLIEAEDWIADTHPAISPDKWTITISIGDYYVEPKE